MNSARKEGECQTRGHAERPTEEQSPSIRNRSDQRAEDHLLSSQTTLGREAAESTVAAHLVPYVQALKATMLYHKTKDPYYVKEFLGHKSLKSTEIYITIERTIFEPSSDEFTVRVVDNPDELKALLEVGFEYVCEQDALVFLRKRK